MKGTTTIHNLALKKWIPICLTASRQLPDITSPMHGYSADRYGQSTRAPNVTHSKAEEKRLLAAVWYVI